MLITAITLPLTTKPNHQHSQKHYFRICGDNYLKVEAGMQAVLSAEKKMGTIEGANKQNVR